MKHPKILLALSLTLLACSAFAKPGKVGSAEGSRVYGDCRYRDNQVTRSLKEVRVDANLENFDVVFDFKNDNFFKRSDIQIVKMKAGYLQNAHKEAPFTEITANRMKKLAKARVGQLGAPHACNEKPQISGGGSVHRITPHEIELGVSEIRITSGGEGCQDWAALNILDAVICKRK